MVFGWGESRDAYQQVYSGEPHEGALSHEIIAGGASFAAFRAFEDQQRKSGKPVDHSFAKEALAALAGAEVDKLAETKGEDFVDREKAKHAAKKQAEKLYEDQYGSYDQYDPNSQNAPTHIVEEFGSY